MSALTSGGASDSSAPPVPDWFARLVANVHRLRFQLPLDRVPQLPVFDTPPRHSAVLVLFGDGPRGDDVLLTRRSATLRAHAGQVAFPGGRIDPGDDGPVAAALREAREETGLDPTGVEVHALGGQLPVSVTNFVVTPVLAWWRAPSPVAPVDSAEVADVVRVPVAELADPANRFTVRHPSGYAGPGFEAGGLFIWGFTAIVLSGVLDLAGRERPWDEGRTVPLDSARAGSIMTPDQLAGDVSGQVPE